MSKTFLRDTVERVLASGLLGFLVLLTASDTLDINAVQAALTAGGLAAASALKAAVASMVGDPASASLDPHVQAVDPATGEA